MYIRLIYVVIVRSRLIFTPKILWTGLAKATTKRTCIARVASFRDYISHTSGHLMDVKYVVEIR